MHTKEYRTAPLLLLLMLGCHSAPTGSTPGTILPVPGSIVMQIGASVQLGTTPYRLIVDSLELDSRCPVEVICVVPGKLRVHALLHATSGLGIPDLEIRLGTDSATPAAGTTLRITAVEPVAHVGVMIPIGEYRLTITAQPAS